MPKCAVDLMMKLKIALNYINAWAPHMVLVVKNPPASAGNVRDVGSVPGLGRSLGGEHGNPLQYSCVENPMDRRAWLATVDRVAVGHN